MHRFVYRLKRVEAPWGDYGEILHHGISWNRGRVDGFIQLERTGPFIPPLTMPSTHHVVVVESLRRKIVDSGLRGYAFVPVVKARIVRLNWESWPPSAKPAKYPSGGEPENYVLRRKHHPASAEALGDLWELTAEVRVTTRPGTPYYMLAGDHQKDFFVEAERHHRLFVSPRAKQWLEETVSDCVAFDETPVA